MCLHVCVHLCVIHISACVTQTEDDSELLETIRRMQAESLGALKDADRSGTDVDRA